MIPADFGFPDKFSVFREAQVEALRFTIDSEKRFRALALPVGSGKSLYANLVAKHFGRTAILTVTKGLQSQYDSDFGTGTGGNLVLVKGRTNYPCDVADNCKLGGHLRCSSQKDERCPYVQKYAEAKASDVLITNYAYWLNVTNKGQGLGTFDCLILDECFPAGTIVDGKPIEQIRTGDLVSSFDDKKLLFKKAKVYATSRRPTSEICRITFSDGSRTVCTPNHPFYTRFGWVRAIDSVGSFVLGLMHEKETRSGLGLRSLRQGSSEDTITNLQSSQWRESDVQLQLRGQYGNQICADRETPSGDQQTPDRKESDGQCCNAPEGENYPSGDGMETACSGRQRKRSDGPATGTGVGSRVGNGSICLDWPKDETIPYLLQTRRCESRIDGGDRGRWDEPQLVEPTRAGLEEGTFPGWAGVECVEVFKRGCDSEFESLCPDGFVYNLEVEETHTYIAEGHVVHNCHDAAKALSSYLDFHVSESEIERFNLPSPKPCNEDLSLWGRWALQAETILKRHLTTTHNPHHRALEAERMESLLDKLAKLQASGMSDDNWVCELSEGTKYGRFWKFDCVWPGQYGEMLFRNIPNVVLMSGSRMRPSELGIKKADVDSRSWPRVFPPNRSPFYHVKSVAVKYGMSDEQERKWLEVIDGIIESRYRNRKGIIHTVSYARQRLILERSRFRQFMHSNSNDPESEEAAAVVERFRNSKAPSILVSPSFGTGWDFPGADCEWQIITNIPFPPMQSKVMKRRKELDPSYQAAHAAKELGQALGRPMRFEKDRAETFIVDDRIAWFVKLAGKFLPEDFSYTSVLEVPAPGPRWNER